MTASTARDGANANLIETYFRLARATPGSTIWRRGNLQGCTGAFNHPICNFVVAAELDEDDIRELCQVTDSQKPFHVYLPPGPRQKGDEQLLTDVGFQPIYKLKQMAAGPLHELPRVRPIEATTHAARLALARFMVAQFFANQPRQYREGVAKSTARAGGLDLYALGFQDDVIGGVMLCREADTLGVYNLCVKPEFQHQGWGRAVIDWARTCAGVEGLTLTLQCDEQLVGWYSNAGFSQIGEIVAFSRLRPGLFDTM